MAVVKDVIGQLEELQEEADFLGGLSPTDWQIALSTIIENLKQVKEPPCPRCMTGRV